MLKGFDKSRKKFRSLWHKGVFLGKSEINDEAFVSTPTGVVSGRTFHRLPGAPIEKDRIMNLIGLPWDPEAGLPAPEVQQPLALPEPVPVVPPQGPPEGQAPDEQ